MKFTIITMLEMIFSLIIFFSFFTILPISLGALYLWFILKMFHIKNLNLWKILGTSFFSYSVIIISVIFLSSIFSLLMITTYINRVENISIYYKIILIIFSSIMSIFTGAICIRKLIKESWGYSILVSFLVLLLLAATFFLIIQSPIGSFIIPPEG